MISRLPLRLVRTLKTLNCAPVCASFCSSLDKINKTGVKLQKIIDKELKYEKTNYNQDETAIDFIEKVGFRLVETDGSNEVALEKDLGDVKVLVTFQSRQPSQEEEEEEQQEQQQKQNNQQQQQQQQEEEQQDMGDYADFTVYLQKKNGQTLCYECTTANMEISVNMVSLITDIEAHRKTPRFERGLNEYQGPDFITLDERLQLALTEYLKEYGITDELGSFIEHYSLDKEQRLYMQWLDSVSTFLKN